MPLADYHEQFAAVYDLIYARRDVAGEARFAVELLGLAGAMHGSRHILDFGCGTGSHALAFGEMGVNVTGFDRSEAMIAQARAKTPVPESGKVSFAGGSLASFCAQLDGRRFDGVVSFFNVLNCIETPGEMVEHLRLLHSRLIPGGRMLIDVWNGAAVFVDEPRPAVKHFAVQGQPDCETVRITTPTLDRIQQCCTLHYRILNLDRRTGNFTEFESVHKLRFLTPVQYRHLFELAGLEIVDEFPKARLKTPVTEHDWYISYLVRRSA
jgi:SAM-dependent methyltransferase